MKSQFLVYVYCSRPVSCLVLFKPANTHVQMVSDLIDIANWTWDRDLVRDTFIAPDAEAILNIPIRRGGGEDFLAWAHETSGIYSVKLPCSRESKRACSSRGGAGNGTINDRRTDVEFPLETQGCAQGQGLLVASH